VVASPGNGFSITGPLVGSVTLAAPLAANLVSATVLPLSWNFAAVPSAATASFSFTTDANGHITGWSVSLVYDDPGDDYEAQATSAPAGDMVAQVSYANVVADPNSEPVSIVGQSTTAGTWVCQQTFTTSYTAPDPPSLQAELTTANQMIEALEAELNSMHANNVFMAKLLGRQ
jgi:hypothetical protein